MIYNEYTDDKGAFVFVSCGISAGASWFTVRQKNSKSGTNRIKSPKLPIRHVKDEAQQDLDRYAQGHNWKVCKNGPAAAMAKAAAEPLPVPQRREDSRPPENPISLCTVCLPRFREAFPFYNLKVGEDGSGKCGICKKRRDVSACVYSRKTAA